MNKATKLVLFMVTLLVGVFAFAQAQDLSQVLPVEDAFRGIMGQLTVGGLKGLALAAAIVQCLMLVLRTYLGDKIAGPWRMVAVYVLSLIAGVIALKMQGMDTMSIILHSQTLFAFQIAAHQAVKQAKELKDKKA